MAVLIIKENGQPYDDIMSLAKHMAKDGKVEIVTSVENAALIEYEVIFAYSGSIHSAVVERFGRHPICVMEKETSHAADEAKKFVDLIGPFVRR